MGGGADTLEGGEGGDVLIDSGDTVADLLDGGPGDNDILHYTFSPTRVTVNLKDGTASGGGCDGRHDHGCRRGFRIVLRRRSDG